jgi:hypothetical protein
MSVLVHITFTAVLHNDRNNEIENKALNWRICFCTLEEINNKQLSKLVQSGAAKFIPEV